MKTVKEEKKEKPVKEKKIVKAKSEKKEKEKTMVQTQTQNQEFKKPHVSKRQLGKDNKKAKLAKAGRQTRWAPVWAVVKKYGTGKRIHPSAMTAYKRNWRRTKLHIKPRRIKKWHMG